MNDSQAKRNQQVPQELEKLEGSINDLKEALNVLEKSVSTALTQPDPLCATPRVDVSPLCDLADLIAAYQQRIGELVLFVQELTGRVEL